jgi:hypothetical protein
VHRAEEVLTVDRPDYKLRDRGVSMSLVLALLSGCTNSGLGRTTAETGDTAAGTTEVQNCPWVGTWQLDQVNCGAFPYDSWYDAHDGATLDIDHDPAGGCVVQAEITGPACSRTEAWRFSVPLGTSVDVTFEGITDCNPNQCAFSVEEEACERGGLAGSETLTIDDSTGNLLAVDLFADTAPECTLGLQTTWLSAR